MDECGRETQLNPGLPKVEIDEEIKSSYCSYDVGIDRQGAAELLKMAGVSEEEIPNMSIVLKKRSPKEEGDTLFGIYYPRNKSITLYTDNIYSRFPIIGRAVGVLSGRDRQETNTQPASDKNLFPELVSGKRFTAYLNVVSKERGIEMAEKLQAIAAGRTATQAIGHEARHAGNDSMESLKEDRKRRKLAKAITGGAGAGIGAGVTALALIIENLTGTKIDNTLVLALVSGGFISGSYIGVRFFGKDIYYRFFDQEEKQARALGKEIAHNPKYKLITFTPK